VSVRLTLGVSGPAFDSAAAPFTAKGQAIIEDGLAPQAKVSALADDCFGVLDWLWDLDPGDLTPCFAGALCLALAEWPAQASPLTINAFDPAGCAALVVAAAKTFSQPSRQPAPAIQAATATASVTLVIRNKENWLI